MSPLFLVTQHHELSAFDFLHYDGVVGITAFGKRETAQHGVDVLDLDEGVAKRLSIRTAAGRFRRLIDDLHARIRLGRKLVRGVVVLFRIVVDKLNIERRRGRDVPGGTHDYPFGSVAGVLDQTGRVETVAPYDAHCLGYSQLACLARDPGCLFCKGSGDDGVRVLRLDLGQLR